MGWQGKAIDLRRTIECCDCHCWFTVQALDKQGRCHSCRDKLGGNDGNG